MRAHACVWRLVKARRNVMNRAKRAEQNRYFFLDYLRLVERNNIGCLWYFLIQCMPLYGLQEFSIHWSEAAQDLHWQHTKLSRHRFSIVLSKGLMVIDKLLMFQMLLWMQWNKEDLASWDSSCLRSLQPIKAPFQTMVPVWSFVLV